MIYLNKSSTEEVNNSLIEVKTLISAGSWDFIPRKKNMDCLAELGLSKRNAIDIMDWDDEYEEARKWVTDLCNDDIPEEQLTEEQKK